MPEQDKPALVEDDSFFKHQHDFSNEIRGTLFAEDYDLTVDEIARLNFAVNEYLAAAADGTDRMLGEQAKLAPSTLLKASQALNKAVHLIKETEANAYARSAIISALPAVFGRGKGEDELLDAYSAGVAQLEVLSATLKQAAEQQAYSNGLPEIRRGAPADPAYDKLLWRLTQAVADAIRRNASQDQNGPSPAPTSVEVARCVCDVLDAVGLPPIEPKTIQNLMRDLWASPFPGIT